MRIAIKYYTISLLAMMAGICFIPVFSNLPFTNIAAINIPDIILYYLLFLIILRKIRFSVNYTNVKTPLSLPLILFFLVALFGLLIGKIAYSYNFFEAFLEFKVIIYYLVAIIVTNIFRNKQELNILIKGCFLLAVIVSLTHIIKISTNFPQLSGSLYIEDIYYMVLSQGGLLVFWTLCCFVCLLIVQRRTLWHLIGATFCLIFIVLSFSRHYWISLFFSILFIFFIARRKYLINIFKLTFLMLFLALIFISTVLSGIQPFKRYKELISYRLHSLEWIDQTGSYSYRQIENEYAIAEIKKHIIFGIGFKRSYRPQLYYPEDNIRHFIHNGYLWILLKMGIIGFIIFLWFSCLFVKRGLTNWKKINNLYYKGIILGSVASYLGIAFGNLAAPHFTQNWEAAVLGLSFGVNEVIYRIEGIDNKSNVKIFNP